MWLDAAIPRNAAQSTTAWRKKKYMKIISTCLPVTCFKAHSDFITTLCRVTRSNSALLKLTEWTWWHLQMETFFTLLVPGEFPAQRPVTRSFDVFFDKRLSKQSWGWWRYRAYYDVIVMNKVDYNLRKYWKCEFHFRFGRRAAVFAALVTCIGAKVGSAVSANYQLYVACRFLTAFSLASLGANGLTLCKLS